MSELFNLKEWLTVAEAARHLAIVFGEEVTEADVLRLALDGRLRLSAYFVNHATARCGKIVRYSKADLEADVAVGKFSKDLKWTTFPPEIVATLPGIPDEMKGKPMTYLMSLRIDDNRYVTLGDKVTTIEGVWDLPMIGAEQLDVEHEYQNLTGGPAVTLSNIEGAFVEGCDGQICQLQADYDDNEFQAGSRAQLEELKQHIAEKDIGSEEAGKLMNRHKENRKKFLEERKSQSVSEHYHPAGGLPLDDSVLVVRTNALRQFEEAMNGTPVSPEKPITTTERNTLLTVIAALCDYSDIK